MICETTKLLVQHVAFYTYCTRGGTYNYIIEMFRFQTKWIFRLITNLCLYYVCENVTTGGGNKDGKNRIRNSNAALL